MNANRKERVSVDDIIKVMEAAAPPQLAEEWDNCGLQVGHADWPVRKIWVALDPLPSVVKAAGQNQVDLVISHHPLIFNPLRRIDLGTTVGSTIATALHHQTAIFAAHTNLDSAAGGINDVLADKIGLTDLTTLIPPAPAFIHDPAVDHVDTRTVGLGRIGLLDPTISVEKLAYQIKTDFMLEHVKVAGRRLERVHRVAVCSGSGGSLLNTFLKSDAEVFVSGDLKYHDARVVEEAGRAIIDIGHFASEHLFIQPLVEQLKSVVQSRNWQIEIEACTLERDPFDLL